MDKEYNIDERLYKSLCDAVEKWFDKHNEYIGFHIWEYGNGISFSAKDIKHHADFGINICTDTRLERNRYEFLISFVFYNAIPKDVEYESRLDILELINWYNGKVHGAIKYVWRNIGISRDFYFYKGTVIADDEISRILDEFFFNEYLDELAEVLASGVYKIPDPKPMEPTSSANSLNAEDEIPF